MSEPDPQLVQTVVQHVLAALRASGAETTAATTSSQAAAASAGAAAPAAARARSTMALRPAGGSVAAAPAEEPVPRRTFLTANALQRRLAANGASGVVELAAHEALTPSARDLAERKGVSMRRNGGSALSRAAAGGGAPAGPGALGLVTDGPGPRAEALAAAIERAGGAPTAFDASSCWMENLEALCRAVAAGQVAAGVVLAPDAAAAVMLANKVRGVRAVQGTSPTAVAAAVRGWDANLLAAEAGAAFHEMRQMVRALLARAAEPAERTALDVAARLEGA